MKNSKIYIALQKTYERLLKIRGQPREIALGFALGIFIGMTPTIGFQMAIAVPIAALLKWNKISSAIGVWISNPVTAPFIYGATYLIGAFLMGISDDQNVGAMISLVSKIPGIIWDSAFGNGSDISIMTAVGQILSKTSIFLLASTIGGIIVGIPMSLAAYYFAYSAIEKYQEDIKKKLAEKKKQRTEKKKQRSKKKAEKKKLQEKRKKKRKEKRKKKKEKFL